MKSMRVRMTDTQRVIALLAGLLSGLVLFGAIEPAILGQRPTPLFDREASIFFTFKLFPLLIVPAVCIIIAALRPATRSQAFRLGAIVATTMLLPVPIFDEWRTIPSQYGWPAFSWRVLAQVVLLASFLLLLAAIVTTIAGLVSPLIYRRFSHETVGR